MNTTRPLGTQAWRACFQEFVSTNLKGRECWGGVEISRRLASLVLVFNVREDFFLLPFFWTPEQRSDFMTTMRWARNEFELQSVAYDPYGSSAFMMQCEGEGIVATEFCKTWSNFDAPTSHFEELVNSQKLHHNNNIILNWQAESTSIEIDRNGRRRLQKTCRECGTEIDGIVAAVLGLGLYQGKMCHG